MVLRTPEARFAHLPGYPFAPHYVTVGENLRMHYVDEGDATAPVVLLLHGEPTWSFLYRKMIPVLVHAGLRTVAPDLVGFGKSDKPTDPALFTYQRHVDWLAEFVEGLELRDITLVCQDWGGLLGLRVLAAMPDRFARVVAANTGLPTGDRPAPEAFQQWQQFSQTVPELPVGKIVSGGCAQKLPPEVVAAYDAPFPDETYKVAARRFPALVPTTPADPAAEANRQAWKVLQTWHKPFLTAFSDGDPITAGGDRVFQKLIPGAAGQPHVTIAGAGHFLQEDRGEDLAKVVAEFVVSG
jgi:haloalkane dehalogenase